MKLGKLVAKGVAQDAPDAEVEVGTTVEEPRPETVEVEPVTAGSSAER